MMSKTVSLSQTVSLLSNRLPPAVRGGYLQGDGMVLSPTLNRYFRGRVMEFR